jgi:hypothetical protein
LGGWRDAHELALVGPVEGLTRRYHVPFGDHVLDGEIGIREGLAKHNRNELDTLTVRRHSRWRAVIYEFRGAELIYGVDVALALYFVDEASDYGLVLLYRHPSPPCPSLRPPRQSMMPDASTRGEIPQTLITGAPVNKPFQR